MTIKRRNCDPYDSITAHLRAWRITLPNTGTDYFVTALDLTTVAVGDVLTLKRNVMPADLNMAARVTDAATNAIVGLKITGINQFGERVTSEITIDTTGGSPASTFTNEIYSLVQEVKITSLTGIAAGATLDVGPQITGSSTKIGLPIHVLKNSTTGVDASALGNNNTVKVVLRGNTILASGQVVDPATSSFTYGTMAVGDEFTFRFGAPFAD